MERKKGFRLGFRPRSKGKRYAAYENDHQDTAFWEKGKKGGRKKKERERFFHLSKECLHHGWVEEKKTAKIKDDTNFSTATSTSKCRTTSIFQLSTDPEKLEFTQAKEAGVTTMTNIGLMTGRHGIPTTDGYDGDYSQGEWHAWSYFASVGELTIAGDKHMEDAHDFSVAGQTDQHDRFCFFCYWLAPIFRTQTDAPHVMHSFVCVSCVPALSRLDLSRIRFRAPDSLW